MENVPEKIKKLLRHSYNIDNCMDRCILPYISIKEVFTAMDLEKTYETSILNTETIVPSHDVYTILNHYASTFHEALHSLYAERYFYKNSDRNQQKRSFLKRFSITARQFNAIRYQLDAQVSSSRECQKLHLRTLKGKIKSTNKWVKNNLKKIETLKKKKGSHRAKLSEKKDARKSLQEVRFHLQDRKSVV